MKVFEWKKIKISRFLVYEKRKKKKIRREKDNIDVGIINLFVCYFYKNMNVYENYILF